MVKRVGGTGLDDGADDGVHHWDGAEAMSGEIMAQGNADACEVWEGKERWARWGCRVRCYLEIACDHSTQMHLKSRRNQILEAAFPVFVFVWGTGQRVSWMDLIRLQVSPCSDLDCCSSEKYQWWIWKRSAPVIHTQPWRILPPESSSTNPVSFCITIRHEHFLFNFLFSQV